MFAKEILDNIIQPVRVTDHGLQILSWMEEYKVMQLPVVEDDKLLGVIAEPDIYGLSDPEVSLREITEVLKPLSVFEDAHVFEILTYFLNDAATVVPVVTKDAHYLGVISQYSLIKALARMETHDAPGAVVIIEMNQSDYLLSQLAQIAESSDVQLLSVHAVQRPQSMMMDVVLKTNREEVGAFQKSLERYGYQVKVALAKRNFEMEKLQENYNYIMTYLDI